jgi:glycosyltransferase involved in cell wall biosynthesis
MFHDLPADEMNAIIRHPRAEPPRILVNAIHARAGGGVTYLRNLIPLLAEQGLDLTLLLPSAQAAELAALALAVPILSPPMPEGMFDLLIWEQTALPRLFRGGGYDLLFSLANYGPLLVGKQVIVLQNSLGVGAQEKRPGKRLYWLALGLMTGLSLLVARRAIAVSDHVADAAGGMVRFAHRPKPAVIHHGVAPAFSPPSSPETRGDFLLAVSDLYIQKNLHRLIEAIALVRQDFPSVTLRVAGTEIDRSYAAGLRRLVAEKGLEAHIRFLGRRSLDELVALYRSCALFVFPSTEESFGLPLLEAMACGAPIACARAAAIPEVAGDAARFFDPENVGEIAAVLGAMLRDGALRREFGVRSVARAARFSWAETARKTALVLCEAAADSKATRMDTDIHG